MLVSSVAVLETLKAAGRSAEGSPFVYESG